MLRIAGAFLLFVYVCLKVSALRRKVREIVFGGAPVMQKAESNGHAPVDKKPDDAKSAEPKKDEKLSDAKKGEKTEGKKDDKVPTEKKDSHDDKTKKTAHL